MLSVRTFLGR